MDNGKTSHADPILLDGRSNTTDPGTIPGAEVNTFVRRTQTQIQTAQAPAEAQLVTLLFQCWNLPNVAKQELEAFLRDWCVKHSIAGPIGDHNQQQRQQQQERERRRIHQGCQHEEQRRDDSWARPLLPAAADLQNDGRIAGRCKPPKLERLWSGSLNIAWALYPKIPSVGQVRCSERRPWSSHDAAASWRWRDRLWAHDVPVPLKMQGRSAAGSDDSGPVQDGVRPWQSGAGVEICEGGSGDAVEEDASPGDSGGSASMEERPCTPGCGMISEIGPDSTGGGSGHVNESGGGASIGCALGDGDKARGGDAGHSVTLNSDTTMRRSLLNLEDAIAFNLAYKEENNTPPYNRLPVLALRLGSGLAASALPCAALTHGSALWQVLGAGSTAEVNYGSRLGPADGKVNLRALKRQRIDNNGGNTLSQNFAFVLDRCWNCGSYGHELQDCIHPRKHAVSDVCRRESSLVARRTARQAVAVQRRGPRKASYRRYFSTSTAEEEQEAAEATADASVGVGTVAEYYGKGGGQKRAPPGIRPGVLSAALALALNLSCPLDPPPWLIGMAVHGLPPAYCRGPYIPGVPEPLATDPLSVESCATVAWEGTCSQALCGAPVAAAMVAAAEGCSPDGTEGGEVAVQAVELLHFNPDRAAGDGVEGLPPKTTDVGCPKGSAFPDTQNTSAPTKWVADQPDIIAAVKGSSWGRTGRYNVDDASERLVSGSIAALSGFSPDSEGSEGTRSSSAFAVGQQASAGLRTAAATVAGTAGIASEHGFGGSEGACEEIGPAMEETALERRCGRSDIGARGTESVSFPDGMEPATLLQHSAINAALTIAEQPACAVAIDAAVGVQGIEQELDMDIDMGTDEDTVSLDAAAAGGVAAGSTGSEPDADADAETALLLQPLLPAAPRHVLFAGLNASIPQGACREHWQRALISARQVIACVAVVGGWGRRHEEPQLASTWAAKVTGGGQGPSGAAVDAAPEQVEVVAQAKAVDVPQEQPQQQTWQQESFPQVRQSQPHWQSSMPTQDELQRQAWWHQHKPQLAGNNFVMQQHIMMLKQQQQQHPCLATAFPVFFGVPTFQGFY